MTFGGPVAVVAGEDGVMRLLLDARSCLARRRGPAPQFNYRS